MEYTAITIEEMRQLLKRDKGWYETKNPTVHEHVFECPVKFWHGAVIKVFTSINRHDGNGRRKGGDAIKVVAVNLHNDRGLHTAVRVLRVKGWRENLRNAVVRVLRDLHGRRPQLVRLNEQEIIIELRGLDSQLSPENLYEDGNIDHSQARGKREKLQARWKVLETALGRQITLAELYT